MTLTDNEGNGGVGPGGGSPKGWLALALPLIGAVAPIYLADNWPAYWKIQGTMIIVLVTVSACRRWLR